MRQEGSKTEKFLSSFFFVLDWFKKADAFGYKRCLITGQRRLNFHVWVIEHPKCPKGNRCARGPNTKSTHTATAQKQRLAATGMSSAGSKGRWGGLQSSLVASTWTRMRAAARSWIWITCFHLLVCPARCFWRKGRGCPHGNLPWVLTLTVIVKKCLFKHCWLGPPMLCYIVPSAGMFLGSCYPSCGVAVPDLAPLTGVSQPSYSTVLHLTLLNSARDLQDDE